MDSKFDLNYDFFPLQFSQHYSVDGKNILSSVEKTVYFDEKL